MKQYPKKVWLIGAFIVLSLVMLSFFLLQSVNKYRSELAMDRSSARDITVYKNPNCGCCTAWAVHLRDNGFNVTIKEVADFSEVKQKYNIPRELGACHTAVINGFAVEGHVPAKDIINYLVQPSSDIAGLAVPGMPQGSPGMETGKQDGYSVFAFTADGQYREVNRYGEQ